MNTNASHVLIVDDLPVNRMILSSLLASRGVISDQAESGLKCLELCRENDYDLILLDHRMPDLDGVDTLTRLKGIFKERNSAVPVICHTTEEGRKNINLYKAAGFADVLIKPVEPGSLSEIIMNFLPSENITEHPEATSGLSSSPAGKDLSSEEEAKDELDKLPLWLKIVPHIDLIAGIRGCGSAEDYVDALCVFRSSIEEKSATIGKHLTNNDMKMYRLGVHSLKSMARLIGARTLGDMAAEMEDCVDRGDMAKIRQNTPLLLFEYRRFIKLLDPLMDDEDIKNLKKEAADRAKEAEPTREKADNSHSVLFIQTVPGIFSKGIEKNLTDNGFKVISVPDSPDVIINHRFDADIVIYNPEIHDDSHISLTMSLLGEVCQDDSKILCLTGDSNDISDAMRSKGSFRVSRTYPRPVETREFMNDMKYFSDLLAEFHRMKTVFVVDDDRDYLSLIESWLSPYVNVSCFDSGEDMLSGLSAVIPDLILLDYEMPEIDGFELMKKIRQDPDTCTIPIIFLTGKNDRDHVFSILHYKPDGYLLKSASKEMIIDSIERFFTESFFRMTQ